MYPSASGILGPKRSERESICKANLVESEVLEKKKKKRQRGPDHGAEMTALVQSERHS